MVGRHTNWAAYLINNLLRKIRNHVGAFFLAAQRAVEDVWHQLGTNLFPHSFFQQPTTLFTSFASYGFPLAAKRQYRAVLVDRLEPLLSRPTSVQRWS